VLPVERDIRFDVALFTVDEASRYLGRARSTLRDWTLYALATRRVATDGVSLLIDMAASFENPAWERARDRQQVISEVIQRYLKFVRWDPPHVHATRLRLRTCQGADVIIDPPDEVEAVIRSATRRQRAA
jgi:hypothetical protein